LAHGVSFPSLCLLAQGSKEILLGDKRFGYDPAHYLISTAALPISTRITEATPERPYLGLVLKLDPILVGSVLVEVGHVAGRHHSDVTAIDASPLDVDLLDAVVRLVRLLQSPTDARVLAPPVTREIVYRLLRGAQDERLHQIAAQGGNTHRIAEAIEWLRKDFDQPLRIDTIARELGMSISSFNHHFRSLTAMSPLQFQKLLRLQEARRLMLSEGLDATRAGERVGYGNASHFTREYKRLFSAPPMRDVEQLRDGAGNRALQEATRDQ
jgi:AraC-like DNA-binding protein